MSLLSKIKEKFNTTSALVSGAFITTVAALAPGEAAGQQKVLINGTFGGSALGNTDAEFLTGQGSAELNAATWTSDFEGMSSADVSHVSTENFGEVQQTTFLINSSAPINSAVLNGLGDPMFSTTANTVELVITDFDTTPGAESNVLASFECIDVVGSSPFVNFEGLEKTISFNAANSTFNAESAESTAIDLFNALAEINEPENVFPVHNLGYAVSYINLDDNSNESFAFDAQTIDVTMDIPTEPLLGDVNLDGTVDLRDVGPFIDRVSNGNYQTEADTNVDGSINLLDVDPFVELLAD